MPVQHHRDGTCFDSSAEGYPGANTWTKVVCMSGCTVQCNGHHGASRWFALLPLSVQPCCEYAHLLSVRRLVHPSRHSPAALGVFDTKTGAVLVTVRVSVRVGLRLRLRLSFYCNSHLGLGLGLA